MTWEALNIIGTIAFAISGAIVAMEEEFDLLGVIVLGMVTAFGGGMIRNLLIGLPVSEIWAQGSLFKIALLSMIVVFLLPVQWIKLSKSWMIIFDAIGLSAFAIQGGLYASQMNHAVSAILVAAMLTGIGGGIVRDVFAGRKPLVLHDEIYAAWAILTGVIIGLHWVNPQNPYHLYGLFLAIVGLRMLSVVYKWKLPRLSLKEASVSGRHE